MIRIKINAILVGDDSRPPKKSDLEVIARRVKRMLYVHCLAGDVSYSGRTIKITKLRRPTRTRANYLDEKEREEFAKKVREFFFANYQLVDWTVRVD